MSGHTYIINGATAISNQPKNHIEIVIKKIDDEYQVQWIENGKKVESKTYYTDDRTDAIETRDFIVKNDAIYRKNKENK